MKHKVVTNGYCISVLYPYYDHSDLTTHYTQSYSTHGRPNVSVLHRILHVAISHSLNNQWLYNAVSISGCTSWICSSKRWPQSGFVAVLGLAMHIFPKLSLFTKFSYYNDSISFLADLYTGVSRQCKSWRDRDASPSTSQRAQSRTRLGCARRLLSTGLPSFFLFRRYFMFSSS